MARYTIEINYKASINVDVDGMDEGDALAKAREIAEEADMKEFVFSNELESRVVSVH